jgi:hypothetical protein
MGASSRGVGRTLRAMRLLRSLARVASLLSSRARRSCTSAAVIREERGARIRKKVTFPPPPATESASWLIGRRPPI